MSKITNQLNRELGTDNNSFILEMIVPYISPEKPVLCIEGKIERNNEVLKITPWVLYDNNQYNDDMCEVMESNERGKPLNNIEAKLLERLKSKYQLFAVIFEAAEKEVAAEKAAKVEAEKKQNNNEPKITPRYLIVLRFQGVELTANVEGLEIVKSPTMTKIMEIIQQQFEAYLETKQFSQSEIQVTGSTKENSIKLQAQPIS